jgi:hypothetical protein
MLMVFENNISNYGQNCTLSINVYVIETKG